jgi:hypothetical protein
MHLHCWSGVFSNIGPKKEESCIPDQPSTLFDTPFSIHKTTITQQPTKD